MSQLIILSKRLGVLEFDIFRNDDEIIFEVRVNGFNDLTLIVDIKGPNPNNSKKIKGFYYSTELVDLTFNTNYLFNRIFKDNRITLKSVYGNIKPSIIITIFNYCDVVKLLVDMSNIKNSTVNVRIMCNDEVKFPEGQYFFTEFVHYSQKFRYDLLSFILQHLEIQNLFYNDIYSTDVII